MKYSSHPCETCGQYVFDPAGSIAYQRRDRAIRRVELNGEQPWSGIRLVCRDCLAFFRAVEPQAQPGLPRGEGAV